MSHNHHHCVKHALTTAESLCESRGIRLTPLRLQVLKTLWSSHQARGAYDLLQEINAEASRKLAPLSVYRALDFLVQEGLAHRIESLNAYVGCPHPEHRHALQFLICQNCRNVIELEESKVEKALTASATQHGFTQQRAVIEVVGLCAACQPKK